MGEDAGARAILIDFWGTREKYLQAGRYRDRVRDALTFSLATAHDSGTYGYCALRMLTKAPLRQAPG